MVDIQPAAAEIRRGKKEDRRKETTGQKYNGLPSRWALAHISSVRFSFFSNTPRDWLGWEE